MTLVARLKTFFFSLFFLFFFHSSAYAQGGVPLTLPLFQNNDGHCQTEEVVPEAYTLTCGTMTDDSGKGQKSFPDCVTISERRMTPAKKPDKVEFVSYLENDNRHDEVACPKDQMRPHETILLSIPGGGSESPDQIFGSINSANFDKVNYDGFVYPRVSTVGASRLEDWIGKVGGGFELFGDLVIFPSTYPRTPSLKTDFDDQLSAFRTDPFQRETDNRCAEVHSSQADACPSEKKQRGPGL